MRKTITLTKAILKSFIRNWTSIVMLIIFPLILISILFISFNPNGLQKIPIGVIGEYQDFDLNDYREYFSYLQIQNYPTLGSCMNQLKVHNEYICMEIKEGTPIQVNIYYDNTRNVVIWEILDRIGSSIEYLQKEKSEEGVSDFLVQFRAALAKLSEFQRSLSTTSSQIDGYIRNTDDTIVKLSNARVELSDSIAGMDSDIASAKSTRNNIVYYKTSMYNSMESYIGGYNNLLAQNNIPDPYTANAQREFNQYNNRIDSEISVFDNKIYSYEQTSARAKTYMNDMYNGIIVLQGVKAQLYDHKAALARSNTEIVQIQNNFQSISTLEAETLVSPVKMTNIPAYTGQSSAKAQEEKNVEQLIEDINLLGLQTLFPTMLFLLTMFLALLVSGFIALEEINSSAQKRVKLLPKMSFHSMFSVYISSMIITAVPILCVLLMGEFVFHLPIFANFWSVFWILFLMMSIFVTLGTLLAQIIKKESITLLTSTFLLILFIFLSGYLLPTEKMSNFVVTLSADFPGKIGFDAFAKTVFYSQPISSITGELITLAAWLAVFTIVVVLVRKYRH